MYTTGILQFFWLTTTKLNWLPFLLRQCIPGDPDKYIHWHWKWSLKRKKKQGKKFSKQYCVPNRMRIVKVYIKLLNHFYNVFAFTWLFLQCIFCFTELLFLMHVCSCLQSQCTWYRSEKAIWLIKKKKLLHGSFVNCFSCGRQWKWLVAAVTDATFLKEKIMTNRF